MPQESILLLLHFKLRINRNQAHLIDRTDLGEEDKVGRPACRSKSARRKAGTGEERTLDVVSM